MKNKFDTKDGQIELKYVDDIVTVTFTVNGIFGALHLAGVLDDGIMILLCSVYSVCDIICILFFCPFQTWFMKNKCCSSCRIYNWDYAMMFTPLFLSEKPTRGACWRYPSRCWSAGKSHSSCIPNGSQRKQTTICSAGTARKSCASIRSS